MIEIMDITGTALVTSVNRDAGHHFTKPPTARIRLLEGLGVEGDAHLGTTVQHRSRVAVDPTQPNLRQVHLIAAELFDEVAADGFTLGAGQMGENITTRGIDLLALPQDALLRIGPTAIVRITGLRNPCQQINTFEPGLLKAVLGRDDNGDIVRKAGVMGVVVAGGDVVAGDVIRLELPAGPLRVLERV